MKLSHRAVGRLLAACAVVVFLCLALPVVGQEGRSAGTGHVGLPMDWSFRHVVFTNTTSPADALASRRDPRALFQALARGRALHGGGGAGLPGNAVQSRRHKQAPIQVDWAVSLWQGNTAVAMFPAKFSFDVNATPDCTNDYVVYTLDVAGSATQANLVGLNNLYNGLTSNTCGGNTATVNWAYNTGAANATSPVLSLDGTQIAFVTNANPVVFHVLAWQAAQGSVNTPTTPAAASGTGGRPNAGQMTSLTLTGATGDTLSPPWIDYANDVAYVGTSNGRLYKVLNVFCTTAACQTTPAAPSIDATYGNTACGAGCNYFAAGAGTNVLTGPVLNGSTGVTGATVFIGGSDGVLRTFPSASGTTTVGATLTVGDGNATNGGIVDPPIVDATNSLVYVATGCDSATSTNSVLVQAPTSLASSISAVIGNNSHPGKTACGQSRIHSGTFDDAYIANPSTGHLTVCGQRQASVNNNSIPPELYQFTFGASPFNLNTTPTATNAAFDATNGDQCSPLTDFTDSNLSAPTERLYLGVGAAGSAQAAVSSFNAATLAPVNSDGLSGTIGLTATSGIIVDNISTSNQAANIYFTGLANGDVAGGTCTGTITNITRTNPSFVASVTLNAGTPMTPVVGNQVIIAGTTNFNGTFPIASVTDSTHFTVTTGANTTNTNLAGTANLGTCAFKLSQSGLL